MVDCYNTSLKELRHSAQVRTKCNQISKKVLGSNERWADD